MKTVKRDKIRANGIVEHTQKKTQISFYSMEMVLRAMCNYGIFYSLE